MKTFKKFLLEYYTKNTSDLIKYLDMKTLPKDELFIKLAKEYATYKDEFERNLFKHYLYNISYYNIDYLKDDAIQSYNDLREDYEGDDLEEVTYELFDNEYYQYILDIENGNFNDIPEKLLYDFGEFVYEDIHDEINGLILDKDKSIWKHIDQANDIIKNKWFVHFTHENQYVENIAEHGFLFGTRKDNLKTLALSTWEESDQKELESEGYIFCYPIDDIESNLFNYGYPFVLFFGTGLNIFHIGDKEYQTIMSIDSIRNIIPVFFNEEKNTYFISDKDNADEIYWKDNTNNIDDMSNNLSKWINNNFRQYQKRIVTRTKN